MHKWLVRTFMKTFAVAWAVTALVFLGLDAIWLTLAASRLYRPLLGPLLREDFLIVPAGLFYLIYTMGIVVFAVLPALSADRWSVAVLYGGLLGLFGYAVYDLTNQATLRGWPLTVTAADLAWGTLLTGVAAAAGYCAARVF
jgi:uncharacterized membrane protein